MTLTFSRFTELTRIDQIPFGLPFILSAILLARSDSRFSWIGASYVLPCFILARISGMAFNQLIDRHIDAKNPRTQNRLFPTGRVTVKEVALLAWGSLLLFLLLSCCVNVYTALLSPCAFILIGLYSYIKRVHASCHFVLGAIHFLGPTMAYAACTNSLTLAVLFLSGAAGCLIAGSDILYALQDYDFDRHEKLFSLPARLGIPSSLKIASLTHLISLQCLFSFGIFAEFSSLYFLILPIVAAFLFYFHLQMRKAVRMFGVIRDEKTPGIAPLFFRCNVTVAFITLFFVFLSQVSNS